MDVAGASLLPQSIPPVQDTPRVLIIDGKSCLGDLVREALREGGYEVHVCTDAEPVAQILQAFLPDLVIIDANTSTGSGFELCGELRNVEAARNVPILLAVEELSEQTVAHGLLAGADDVVAPGARLIELQARVRVQLRNRRDRDRLMRIRVERDTYQLEATVDALTGIANRRTFDKRFSAMCRAAHPLAVLFLDVDHFKRVNDTHGHGAGDKVLQAVAQCIYKAKRKGDVCARYGGEEFVLLLPNVTAAEAVAIAEEHRQSIEKLEVAPWLASGHITASVGVAFHEGAEAADPAALCRRADEALYEAKDHGRNRVVQAQIKAIEDTNVLETYLQKQLSNGRAGLPLLPAAAEEALKLAQDPRTDIGRIAKLVERDPSLAARFVALAGSAAYSGRIRPTSTTAALVRIGLFAARDLLLQVVYERAHEKLPIFSGEVTTSFARSVRTAVAARQLGKMIAPHYELAYLCGLLHDIGEARIYRILAAMPEAANEPDKVDDLIRRYHAAAGADVARAWSLPPDIATVCAGHHTAVTAHSPTGMKLVVGADAMVRLADLPKEVSSDVEHADVMLLKTLGVPQSAVPLLVDAVRIEALKEPEDGPISSAQLKRA